MTSFAEKIEALLTNQARAEQKVEQKRIAQRQEKERLEKAKKAKEKTEIAELVDFAQKRVLPLFETIKDRYLGGRGELSFKPRWGIRKCDASVSLTWDRWRSETQEGCCGLDAYLLKTEEGKVVKIEGVGRASPKIELSLEEADFDTKLQDSLVEILSNPDNCRGSFAYTREWPREEADPMWASR